MKSLFLASTLVAFSILSTLDASAQEALQLGMEYPPADEAQSTQELVAAIVASAPNPAATNGIAVRTAHPYVHGLVKAKFIVEPNLPAELKVGLFKQAAKYDAWIRISNSSPVPGRPADAVPDARGMAIKLSNVPGNKLLESGKPPYAQDFISLSHATFNSKTVAEFTKFVVNAGNPDPKISGAYFADPANGGLLKRIGEANIVPQDALAIPYFSAVPYRFGSESKAFKWKIQPSVSNHYTDVSTTASNYLKQNMVATLAKNALRYDFLVQFQKNATTEPIEDATIEWNTPFVKVATVLIPKQTFDTPAQTELGENMAFNPWNTLAAFQPLGGPNRARKSVYLALAALRHGQNHVASQ